MQNNGFSTNKTWNVNGRLVDFAKPVVMGILNVTPDSFYDGNRHFDPTAAIKQTEKMVTDGAGMIDVGGYSSRPGADDISPAEEAQRVVGIIKTIAKEFPGVLISIDTFRSDVAEKAVDAGANIINDITGGDHDANLRKLAISRRAPYIVMHMRGTPKTMNKLTQYENVVKDVVKDLQKKVHDYQQEGLVDMAVDAGFGFAKTVEQNFGMLKKLEAFAMIGRPLLVGISRKSMIWRTLDIKPEDALNGTTALNMVALLKGADILRVHDVKEAVECVKLYSRIG
ncbi:MAG TPA: dihydropteroate synthase [Cyclobacteriaceae bacterium]